VKLGNFTSRASSAAAGVLACALLATPSADAQDGFSTLQFTPNPAQSLNLFNVASAQIRGNAEWGLGTIMNYADDALVTSQGSTTSSLVASQLTLDVLAAIGLGDRLEVGVGLPVVLFQSGDNIPLLGVDGSAAGAGIADPRLALKVLLLNNDTAEEPGGPALALVLDTFFPLGDPRSFQGDDGVRVHPRLAFDYALASGPRISVNAGYMVRTTAVLSNLEVDDVITFGAGTVIPVGAIDIIAEVVGSASALAEGIHEEEFPLELLAGARYHTENGFGITYGAGVGLVAGFGAPDWRAFIGFDYENSGCADCDEDGLINLQDDCPFDAEDFDGFQDNDGCPELDNDGDGVPDIDDACPLAPEDLDGNEDEDGCAETEITDIDGDGIIDEEDACPEDPEDDDGFDDEDGCPDPDNDRDGLLDADDECPDDPEDVDGYEEEVGCPDPDNDGDGLSDSEDACPNEPEDFDGFEDTDGCPEEGEGLVTLTCEQIEIQEAVQFESDSAEIEDDSFELLGQVANVLTTASYITRIRVEGHTDDRGTAESNLVLSERRANAVRGYLVAAGVTQTIDAAGFGEESPVADNTASRGRRENRRVEFHVVEQDSRCE
jgi:outer membrane protein OmpA-like peptidoglycan-associated protein